MQYDYQIKNNCGNADLYFNKATVQNYIQNYYEAIELYKKANEKDSQLDSNSKIISIESNIKQICNYIYNKGKIKPKKIENLVKTIPFDNNNNLLLNFENIISKSNNGIFYCKLVQNLSESNETPKIFLVIDNQRSFGIISLYNISLKLYEKIKHTKGLISIKNPLSKNIEIIDSFNINSKSVNLINNIQIINISNVFIDNIPLINFNI